MKLTQERIDELSDLLPSIISNLPEIATWSFFRDAADIEYKHAKQTIKLPTPDNINYLRWGYTGEAPASTAKMMLTWVADETGKIVLSEEEVEMLYLTFYACVLSKCPEGDFDMMFKLREFYEDVFEAKPETTDFKNYCLDFFDFGQDPNTMVVVDKTVIESKPTGIFPAFEKINNRPYDGSIDDTYLEPTKNGGFVRKLKKERFDALPDSMKQKYNDFYRDFEKLNNPQ